MYHQILYKKPHSAHNIFFVPFPQQVEITFQHKIKWLVFVMEAECVYCAVRTESLNTTKAEYFFKVLNPVTF
jgi:hypothetical protein